MKKSPWVNPVTICIVVCVLLSISFGIQFGESIGTILRQIFLPYSLDISRGTGRQGALAFRVVAFITQIGVIGLVVIRGISKEKATKAAVSMLGIILTLVYFAVIGAGYLLPRLH